jgi:hypothetical protein
MTSPIQFPFLPRPNGNGPLDLVPLLPLRLSHLGVSIDVAGLVDSGSTFNVLPHDVGAKFGANWNQLSQALTLGGAGGSAQPKLLTLDAVIGSMAPIKLVFAWAATNSYPVILGQANYFYCFDVFLYRRQSMFQIQPATP